MQRAWVWLLIAGLLEIVWAIGLKSSDGFRKPAVSAFTVVTMIASFYFLAQAMKTLPVGTAYAIWTGLGAVGTAILGIVVFGESREIGRILSIVLILAGILGLKLASK